jgi:hypothetical protein
MSVSLTEVKQSLHILHSDDDAQLTDLIDQSLSALLRFVGEGYDVYADELNAAQIIWIRWRYYTDEAVDLDPIHNLPRPFVALAGPYRTPTVA